MGRTPDRFPGTRFEDELVIESEDASGSITFVSGAFKLRDLSGSFNPHLKFFSQGSLITFASNEVNLGEGFSGSVSNEKISVDYNHRSLRHLIHFIDDGPTNGFLTGAYKEIVGDV